MKNAGYKLIYAFLWLITLPPLSFLYIISDILYVINFYIVKYRKNVVYTNLRNAFPEKSEKEINRIAKSFYLHLSDFLIESMKSIHLSRRQLDKRMKVKNAEIFQELYDEGKDIALISGHYGNWEWLNILPLKVPHTLLTIYHPLKNPYSDQLINGLRSKFGIQMVPMKNVLREAFQAMERGDKFIMWYLGDQRPPKTNKFWMKFLNQDTGFYQGAEKLAMKYNHAVVYLDIQKRKRGYYQAEFQLLYRNGKETAENEITKKQGKVLEEIIRKKPEYWLWSHRRWKHKPPQSVKNA